MYTHAESPTLPSPLAYLDAIFSSPRGAFSSLFVSLTVVLAAETESCCRASNHPRGSIGSDSTMKPPLHKKKVPPGGGRRNRGICRGTPIPRVIDWQVTRNARKCAEPIACCPRDPADYHGIAAQICQNGAKRKRLHNWRVKIMIIFTLNKIGYLNFERYDFCSIWFKS